MVAQIRKGGNAMPVDGHTFDQLWPRWLLWSGQLRDHHATSHAGGQRGSGYRTTGEEGAARNNPFFARRVWLLLLPLPAVLISGYRRHGRHIGFIGFGGGRSRIG